jgi:toxin ParE1/3/4
MVRVVVSTVAQADTAAILRDLATKAGRAVAADYLASLEALYDRLAVHPDGGAPRPAYGRHVRIGLVWPYIVAYRHVPNSNLASFAWFTAAATSRASCLPGRRDPRLRTRLGLADLAVETGRPLWYDGGHEQAGNSRPAEGKRTRLARAGG